jgi:uncharacterized repeat protein (TIGR01451 family)
VRNTRSTRFVRALILASGVSLALVLGGVASSSAAQNLVVSLNGSPVAGNGQAVLTVGITNNNGADANPVTTLTLPNGVTFVSSDASVGCTTPDAHTVSCDDGTVTTTTPASFHVTVNPDHTATGSITASAAEGSSLTSNTASVDIATESDLVLSDVATAVASVAPAPKAVSGGFIDYALTVDNSAGPSDNAGFVVQDVLPHGATFVSALSTAGCVRTGLATGGHGETVQCTYGVLAAGTGTATFTIRAHVDPSEPANAAYTDSASIFSSDTTDPGPGANADSAALDLVTRADLHAISLTASPAHTPLYANASSAVNAVTYTFMFINNGPSYAQSVNVTDVLASGKLVGIDYGFCSTSGCTPSSTTAYPNNGVLAIGTVHDATTVTVVIHAKADATFRNASNTAATVPTSATVSSSTTDPPATTGDETANESGVSIATVPSPVRNVQAIPGNGNVILTWEPPSYTGGVALKTTQTYKVTVSPAGGGTPIYVDSATAPTVTCPNGIATDCYRLNIGPLNNNTTYTFDVQAQNDVGFSDVNDGVNPAAEAQARPSTNAAAQIVPNAGQTLTTCTTATSTQKTCVQYLIPSGGNGGVFGALGGFTLPAGFCGGLCAASTGAQNVGALAGYPDRFHPLVEIITWDSSTLPPSLPLRPVCSTNSTATNCFPNNLPIYYETSAFLLANDPRGATFLNAPTLPHFCSLAVNKGGAGNLNYARPTPAGGYTDTAGSACIKKISVLNGLPGRPADKGDVQVVINLTSDSDALAGHH